MPPVSSIPTQPSGEMRNSRRNGRRRIDSKTGAGTGASRIGMKASDIDLVEINEAFAAVALKLMRDMGWSEEQTNVNGGAIAMGHPLGATGAMILGTLVDELERRDLERGIATLCIGGGMGVATIVERV